MPEIQVKDKLITLEELGAAINAKAGVTSVNNQTGAVSITPANIGAVAKAGDNMTGPLNIQNTLYSHAIEVIPPVGVGNGGYVDFAYNGEEVDYTSRIIEDQRGVLNVNGVTFQNGNLTGSTNGYSWDIGTEDTINSWVPVFTANMSLQHRVLPNWLNNMDIVPVGRGGTGGTTPDGACANIGAVKKGSFTSTLLYSGTPAVNTTFTLSDYVGNYNILRIVDTHHYYCDVYMPVHASTQAIMANGSTSYPYDGTPRFLLWEFTAITSDGINYTVSRKAQANITSTGVEAIITEAEFGIQIYGLK